MTLTIQLDLDILPLGLHAEIQVRMSVRCAVRVVIHTHKMSKRVRFENTQRPRVVALPFMYGVECIITPRVSDVCNSFDIVCLSVCVCYHSSRRTNKQTNLNFGMEVKWKDI